MTTLTELAAILEAATGPSRELDDRLWALAHQYDYPLAQWVYRHKDDFQRDGEGQTYTDSIDAAETLRQRLLPGSFMWLDDELGTWECRLVFLGASASDDVCVVVDAHTECLARLKATVAALVEKEKNDEA